MDQQSPIPATHDLDSDLSIPSFEEHQPAAALDERTVRDAYAAQLRKSAALLGDAELIERLEHAIESVNRYSVTDVQHARKFIYAQKPYGENEIDLNRPRDFSGRVIPSSAPEKRSGARDVIGEAQKLLNHYDAVNQRFRDVVGEITAGLEARGLDEAGHALKARGDSLPEMRETKQLGALRVADLIQGSHQPVEQETPHVDAATTAIAALFSPVSALGRRGRATDRADGDLAATTSSGSALPLAGLSHRLETVALRPQKGTADEKLQARWKELKAIAKEIQEKGFAPSSDPVDAQDVNALTALNRLVAMNVGSHEPQKLYRVKLFVQAYRDDAKAKNGPLASAPEQAEIADSGHYETLNGIVHGRGLLTQKWQRIGELYADIKSEKRELSDNRLPIVGHLNDKVREVLAELIERNPVANATEGVRAAGNALEALQSDAMGIAYRAALDRRAAERHSKPGELGSTPVTSSWLERVGKSGSIRVDAHDADGNGRDGEARKPLLKPILRQGQYGHERINPWKDPLGYARARIALRDKGHDAHSTRGL